jgi:hypothetical protein
MYMSLRKGSVILFFGRPLVLVLAFTKSEERRRSPKKRPAARLFFLSSPCYFFIAWKGPMPDARCQAP